MTNTHDKEWIELQRNNIRVSFINSQGRTTVMDMNLLDQIRRDTIDNFLKWLEEQDLYFTNSKIRMPSDIRHQYLKRAKMLREK